VAEAYETEAAQSDHWCALPVEPFRDEVGKLLLVDDQIVEGK
jgi:hypothetical protein